MRSPGGCASLAFSQGAKYDITPLKQRMIGSKTVIRFGVNLQNLKFVIIFEATIMSIVNKAVIYAPQRTHFLYYIRLNAHALILQRQR